MWKNINVRDIGTNDKIFRINGEGLKHSLRRAEAVISLQPPSKLFSHLIQSRLIRRYFTLNYPQNLPSGKWKKYLNHKKLELKFSHWVLDDERAFLIICLLSSSYLLVEPNFIKLSFVMLSCSWHNASLRFFQYRLCFIANSFFLRFSFSLWYDNVSFLPAGHHQ